VNEPESKSVLDYATPSKSGGGMPLSNSQARMISASVMFVGATILSVSRQDTVVIGIPLGLLALGAFTVEYVRSWRGSAH
jgi:hypothetical protein